MSAAIASFITLAIVGMLDAGYLVWKHYKHNTKPLVCPLNHDCSTVTESRWSSILGVRNETLGLLFYVSILVAGILLFVMPKFVLLKLLVKIAVGGGLLFSLFLLWVQLYKVRSEEHTSEL